MIRGDVIVPVDPRYAIASQPWNARFERVLPAAVVVVADAGDVATTIKFARENSTSFVVRSGRHSFAGFSANTGLIVDTTNLKSLGVDRSRQQATFGAGWTILPLYNAVWPTRMTVPAGVCPTVGLGGLSAAGGFGRLSRTYGLTCDNIVQAKVVDANGALLTANQHENADLWWALRGGGGGNFGAVVEFTAQMHPADMPFTEITYVFPLAVAVRVMLALQDWVAALPDNGHIWTEIDTGAPSDGAVVKVEFTYAGSPQRALALGQALVDAVGSKPSSTSVVTAPYITIMDDISCKGLRPDECAFAGVSLHGVLPRPAFYAKSDMMRETWPSQPFEALVDAIARRQANPVMTPPDFRFGVNVGKIAFESAGGAISRQPSSFAAFAHRDTRFVAQYQGRWHPDAGEAVADTNIAWTQAMYESVRPWLSGSAYQGYADPFLADWPQQYYGASLPRLREIKRKYDPANVFHYRQSLSP